jgi:2-polyprenyl-3-methyl-5-hydroxy-6-metoxy-1,4-benzoquinol methylase
MQEHINYIVQRIESLNPLHGKKIKKNMTFFDEAYEITFSGFLKKYITYLETENKTLDYAIDCYLSMIADMNVEAVDFFRTGKYSSSTFQEVNERVYAKPGIMEYYMHGLIMSQFLWKHHYQLFSSYIEQLPNYASKIGSYLEIGAGHGLYLSRSLEILNNETTFVVVDISPTSIDLAKRFTDSDRVNFHLMDVFDFSIETKFDFITMGEVLEHVEEPLKLLTKLNDLLNEDGTVFITTPTNAPTIDHLYLFNNVMEIQALIRSAGFEIESEMSFLSEDVSPEKAEKFKVSTLYGAFLKKTKK